LILTIERLAPGEDSRLRRIRMAALEDAPDAFGTTLEEAAAWPDSRWTEQTLILPTFIAMIDGQDCGMVRAAPHATRQHTASLISMWVHPDRRGTGTGEALVQAVINWARSAGYTRLLLDVADHNLHAVRLYSRCGFRATGVVGSLPPPRAHVLEHEMAVDLLGND